MHSCEKPNYIFKNYPNDKWKFLTAKKYNTEAIDYPIKMQVPCGHCKACLESQAFKLKQRLLLQMEESKTAYFITLTYNDNNLIDKSTHIKDLREYVKRVRNFYRNNFNLQNIKSFGVSEYGDTSMRPHYHLIIFNIPIWECDYISLKPTKTPKNIKDKIGKTYWINENYFTNTKLHELWKKGRITISSLNEKRIDYIVNYMYKSMNDLTKKKKQEMKEHKMELPKRIQSKNLGLETILNNKISFLNDNYIIINGEKIYANKYIDKKANIYTEERSEARLYKSLERTSHKKITNINNHKGTI